MKPKILMSNPAGRLYLVLSDAMAFPERTATREIWAGALGIEDPTDTGALLQGVVAFFEQIALGKAEVQRLPAEEFQQLYLAPFEKIEKAFESFSLNVSWEGFKKRIPVTALSELLYCAAKLAESRKSDVIEAD